jgi:signal transduction histidine kinase
MGYIDLALSNDLSNENRQENIEGLVVARQSGGLLLDIVGNILDQAKIAAGAMTIDCSLFELRNVVDHVCALGRSLVENQKDIEIVSEISDDIAEFIHGDQVSCICRILRFSHSL